MVPRWFDGVTNMKVAQGWRKSIGLAGDSAINWTLVVSQGGRPALGDGQHDKALIEILAEIFYQ